MSSRLTEFKRELGAIEDERIRGFTEWVLEEVAGDWFWEVPASKSDEFHPAWALGEGGLVRHTKAVVYLAREMCRARSIDEVLKIDQVTSAAVIHDVVKWGQHGPRRSSRCEWEHEHHDYLLRQIVGRELRTMGVRDRLLIENRKLEKVLEIAETHMGRWSRCPRPIHTKLQWVLHLADFVASRTEIRGICFDAPMFNTPF